MASGQLSGIKRFLLWDYPRAGWQYDVMVAIILAFIFLTPREIFRDQPRASNVVRLPAEHGSNVFWVEPAILTGVPENEQSSKAARVIRSHTGKNEKPVRIEPIVDREQEIIGYLVYTRP